jgi:hypothetical protein
VGEIDRLIIDGTLFEAAAGGTTDDRVADVGEPA